MKTAVLALVVLLGTALDCHAQPQENAALCPSYNSYQTCNVVNALVNYRLAHAEQTDALIATLRDIASAYKSDGSREQRMSMIEALLEKNGDEILAQCVAHNAVTENNYLPFLPRYYSDRRRTLFLFLETVPLVSTTQDRVLTDAMAFLLSVAA